MMAFLIEYCLHCGVTKGKQLNVYLGFSFHSHPSEYINNSIIVCSDNLNLIFKLDV